MAASSGIEWVDLTFDWCVALLYQAADLFGITYEEINVWLFVIIGPLLLVSSLALKITLLTERRQSRHLSMSAVNEEHSQ